MPAATPGADFGTLRGEYLSKTEAEGRPAHGAAAIRNGTPSLFAVIGSPACTAPASMAQTGLRKAESLPSLFEKYSTGARGCETLAPTAQKGEAA